MVNLALRTERNQGAHSQILRLHVMSRSTRKYAHAGVLPYRHLSASKYEDPSEYFLLFIHIDSYSARGVPWSEGRQQGGNRGVAATLALSLLPGVQCMSPQVDDR